MSKSEKGGFFRGAEFSRLIILAAMLAIGWPLVVYYGFATKKPEPPKTPPIASLPPLPPPDDDKAFAPVLDKTVRTFRDDDAMALLLERVRKTPPATLAASARREVTPLDLLQKPRRYRGLPIHLDGYAETVFALDDQDPAITPKKRLYEVWIKSSEFDQRMYPCCLILEDVPPSLPGGKNLGERVSVDGYFLKHLRYQAGDKERYAPMLVGRLSHLQGEGTVKEASRPGYWTYLPLGLLFVYISIRVLFTIRKNLVAKNRKRQFFPPDDRIEPDELGQWLANPKPGEDKDLAGD